MNGSLLKELSIIALVVAIKNNEDMVLKLDECLNVLESFEYSARFFQLGDEERDRPFPKFTTGDFASLERQFLSTIQFTINPPTALDFCLALAHRVYEPQQAQDLAFKCLPFIFTVTCDYTLGRH